MGGRCINFQFDGIKGLFEKLLGIESIQRGVCFNKRFLQDLKVLFKTLLVIIWLSECY